MAWNGAAKSLGVGSITKEGVALLKPPILEIGFRVPRDVCGRGYALTKGRAFSMTDG